MNEWTSVCAHTDLPAGAWRSVAVNNFEVLVFNLDGAIYAVEASCTVNGAKLRLECDDSRTLRCPHNGVQFDIRTGMPLTSPPFEPLARFQTRVRKGMIEVHRDPWL